MIRIGLLSEDRALQTFLHPPSVKSSSGFGNQRGDIARWIDSAECDVLILDLNSNNGLMKERVECSRRIIAQRFRLW